MSFNGFTQAFDALGCEVYRICIEDPPIAAVEPAEIENLRYGLNAVARYLR